MAVSQSDAAGAPSGAGKGKDRASTSTSGQEPDEKVLRRRLQYKFHQRRHRAKQKQKLTTLEHEVQTLVADVDTLERRRQQLLVDRNWFSSRGTAGGVPARVAMEYFRLFEYGVTPLRLAQQEQFLRSVMSASTEGPDYVGVDVIVSQWRLFGSFFTSTRYDCLSLDVSTVADLTVVVVDTVFHLRSRRDGLVALYPSLSAETELLQKVVGSVISIPVKHRFAFDANGIITWFSTDWDAVPALARTLGSLEDVNTLLAGSNISTCTGQISCSEDDLCRVSAIETPTPVDPRHNVAFLLS